MFSRGGLDGVLTMVPPHPNEGLITAESNVPVQSRWRWREGGEILTSQPRRGTSVGVAVGVLGSGGLF